MSDPASFDFTKFVPGFDFLKNFTPRDGATPTSAATGWIAPTLDPQELDKRIQELKTVQFWLEQNTKAVAATIQALEVQRMTLNTLKSMNMSFNDLALSLKAKPTTAPTEPAHTEPAAVDPVHWWGALTDQFQHIATHAMKDMTERAHAHASSQATKPKEKPAAKQTQAKVSAGKTTTRKTAVRQAATQSKR